MLGTLQTFVTSVSNGSTAWLSQHHWQNAASKAATQNKAPEPPKEVEDLPEYSLAEVSEHANLSDCWIVMFDRVYDVTNFIDEHPGGQYIMQESAGRDATMAFRGSRHSKDAYDMLDKFLIGILPEVSLVCRIFEIFSSFLFSCLLLVCLHLFTGRAFIPD